MTLPQHRKPRILRGQRKEDNFYNFENGKENKLPNVKWVILREVIVNVIVLYTLQFDDQGHPGKDKKARQVSDFND